MGEEKNNGRHHSKRVPTLISEWTLQHLGIYISKGWLAIAKLKPLSLFISLLSLLKEAFDNVEI